MFQDSRGYWYRSTRSGGRVTREYVGRGLWGEAMAQLDRLDRQSEADATALTRSQCDEIESRDREAKAAFDAVTMAVAAALESLGFHQHARGQWRKRQWRKRRTSNLGVNSVAKTKAIEVQSDTERICALIPKARKDKNAAAELWQLLDANGTAENFVRGSDVAYNAELSLIKSYAGEDLVSCEMAKRRLALMRRDLAGENPTPLESLLITRIAMCWMQVNICEMTLAQRHSEMTLTVADYQTKRLDRAQKRYLSAINALAQVRKLQLPTMQVNIGEKQINIAQANGVPLG